jgi:hypothetical protein
MRPNTSESGIFSTKRKQAGQHQHVDQDVGAEPEERVPVARCPMLDEGSVVAIVIARSRQDGCRDAPASAGRLEN